MYTKCVYILPLTAVDIDFALHLKKLTRVISGTVYTKCVYILPLTAVDIDFALHLKKLTRVIRGTVYTEQTYSCYKRNGVHKMCIHRSS